jgi:hypothetical protein
MPPRYARARLEPGDPKVAIRRRYMEAIRNGATIEDATHYANGESDTFRNTAPVVETAPQAGYGKPGDGEQTLPLSWTADAAPAKKPPAVDESAESFKRPLSAAPASQPAAVSTPAEKPPAAETKSKIKPPLPADWDGDNFPWAKLRALAMAMGLPTPNNRGEAVRGIRTRLAADA